MRKLFISILLIFALAALVVPQTTKGTFVAKGQGVVRRAASGGGSSPFILTQTLGTARNDSNICVGISFDTPASSPPTVTDLGRWKISGNSGTHTVYLFSCGGNDCFAGGLTAIANVSVDTTTGSAGSYVYAAITPIALSTSQRYLIASVEVSAGDQWYDSDTTVNSVTTAGGTYVAAVYTLTGGCGSGYATGGAGAYVPTNFKFTP